MKRHIAINFFTLLVCFIFQAETVIADDVYLQGTMTNRICFSPDGNIITEDPCEVEDGTFVYMIANGEVRFNPGFQAEPGSTILASGGILSDLSNVPDYMMNYNSDDDGLPDWWEILSFQDIKWDETDDNDNDGLNNGDEFVQGTSPTKWDTDGDQIPDKWEVDNGLNPKLADDGIISSDGDLLTNAQEYRLGSDIYTTNIVVHPEFTPGSVYNTIQDAIDATIDSGNPGYISGITDVVYVDNMYPGYLRPREKYKGAPHIYTGMKNTDLDFGGKSIILRSVNGPDFCILDCEKNSRIITLGSGQDSTISGIAIRNGSADNGGGIYCETGSSPIIENCYFTGNTASEKGGAIYCAASSTPTIRGCLINGNIASEGGGVYCVSSNPIISESRIERNRAIFGGGIYDESSSGDINNCIFVGNEADNYGAGLYFDSSDTSLSSCTITENIANINAGGLFADGSTITITNSIVWNNLPENIYNAAGANPTVTYSCLSETYPGVGNITEDPMLVTGKTGNYHLRVQSPCIDSGAPACPSTIDIDGEERPQGSLCDMGADEVKQCLVYPDDMPAVESIHVISSFFGYQSGVDRDFVAGRTNYTDIAAGYNHALVRVDEPRVDEYGKIWAWGKNNHGQLGDYRNYDLTVSERAERVLDGVFHLMDAVKIDAGKHHSALVKADGSVWLWGDNSNGQLGIGDEIWSPVPLSRSVKLIYASSVVQGDGFTAILAQNGRVWTWGKNASGQLGDGTTTDKDLPVKVMISNVMAIAAGKEHMAVVKNDGTVWTWGNNSHGQLGNGTTDNSSVPVQVSGTSLFKSVSCGSTHTLGIDESDAIWAWGNNASGQLGNGTNDDSSAPLQISSSLTFTRISCAYDHSMGIDDQGSIWAWGSNSEGQLGNGNTDNSNIPVQASGTQIFVDVSGGKNHSLAVDNEGVAWAWGDNAFGQLGIGSVIDMHVPTKVISSDNVTGVCAGSDHSLLLIDGLVWACGNNSKGQLGNNNNSNQSIINYVPRFFNLTSISAGSANSAVIDSNGMVWIWGDNANGQIGNGRNLRRPVRNHLISDIEDIALGASHTLTLKNDGTVWAWGDNFFGQLGNGTMVSSRTPVQVQSTQNFVAIACGDSHSMAIDTNGSIWTWGNNSSGQLGDGTTSGSSVPVKIQGTLIFNVVDGGMAHTAAVDSSGNVWAWGDNTRGQLGDGTFVQKLLPVQVTSLAGISSIACGGFHTLALDALSSVYSWGANDRGQLGNLSRTDSNLPVLIPGLTAIEDIDGGDEFSMALGSDGTIRTWGDNAYGQLGDGTILPKNQPGVMTNRIPKDLAIQAVSFVMEDEDIYRLYTSSRWKNNDIRSCDGDHTIQHRSSTGGAGTWVTPHDPPRPEYWQGREEVGCPENCTPNCQAFAPPEVVENWYWDNQCEPIVIKVPNYQGSGSDKYFMYSDIAINAGWPIDYPAGAVAGNGVGRTQVHTSDDGSNWTRFTDRGVVINFDNPEYTTVTQPLALYVPKTVYDPDPGGEEKPFWLYVFEIDQTMGPGIEGMKGYYRIRSADPYTFDWQERERTRGPGFNDKLAYAIQTPGGPLFMTPKREENSEFRFVPTLYFSRDGINWFGDGIEMSGSKNNYRYSDISYTIISTLNGTGELKYIGNNSYYAIYGGMTTNVSPFYSRIGVGDTIITVTPAP